MRQLLPALAIAAVFAAAFVSAPLVQGLEYEDAYVSAAAAAWRSAHWLHPDDGFFNTVCLAGPASNCVLQGSFGTQTIGFSALIAGVSFLVGESPHLDNLLSVIATTLCVLTLWSMLVKQVSNASIRLFGLGLLLTAPSFYTMSATGFSEPLFCFLLILHLSFCLGDDKDSPWGKPSIVRSLAFLVSGALMISVKKEGVLVDVAVLTFALSDYARARLSSARHTHGARTLVALCFCLLAYATFVLGIFDAAIRHGSDIGESAFGLANIPRLLPVVMQAAFSPTYFGVLAPVFLIAAAMNLRFQSRSANLIFVLIVGYVALYSSHARHISYVQGAAVDPREMIRYLFVIAPLVSLFIAIVASQAYVSTQRRQRSSRKLTATIVSVVVVGALAALAVSNGQRSELAFDEARNRTRLIEGLSDTQIREGVFVTPYSAALTAIVGKDILIVDERAVTNPDVTSWLHERIGPDTVIYVDRILCDPAPSVELTDICKQAVIR